MAQTRERHEIRVCPNGSLAKPVDVMKFVLPRTFLEPRKQQTEPLAKPVDVTKFALNTSYGFCFHGNRSLEKKLSSPFVGSNCGNAGEG